MSPKIYRMLSLTTMMAMPTFHDLKLTENTNLAAGALFGGTNTVAKGAGHTSYLLLPCIAENR